MPTYEYQCDKCGFRFERRQSIVDDPISVCPQCGGTTRRLIHPAGIVYKTNGFYVTDNRPRPKEDSGSTTSTTGVASTKKD